MADSSASDCSTAMPVELLSRPRARRPMAWVRSPRRPWLPPGRRGRKQIMLVSLLRRPEMRWRWRGMRQSSLNRVLRKRSVFHGSPWRPWLPPGRRGRKQIVLIGLLRRPEMGSRRPGRRRLSRNRMLHKRSISHGLQRRDQSEGSLPRGFKVMSRRHGVGISPSSRRCWLCRAFWLLARRLHPRRVMVARCPDGDDPEMRQHAC